VFLFLSLFFFFFSSRRRHTRFSRDWSSDVCSSDLYGGGGTWESQSFDTSSTTTAIARLTTRFLEVFPAFRGVQLIRAFAGTVDLTPDARPLLGRADGWENVCVAAGFSGHGFGWSAAAGAIAAACVARALGHEEPAAGVSRLLEPLAPCRHAPAARPQVRGG